MRFDSGELLQNTNEIVAYGTAVVIAPAPTHDSSFITSDAIMEAAHEENVARSWLVASTAAWHAHAFHRFAHHPLCDRYVGEVMGSMAVARLSRLSSCSAWFG